MIEKQISTKEKPISNRQTHNVKIALESGFEPELVGKILDTLHGKGLLAGDRGGRIQSMRFEGTDGTCYFPNLSFKSSKRKGANNIVPQTFKLFSEEWKTLTLPIFEKLQRKYMVDPTK